MVWALSSPEASVAASSNSTQRCVGTAAAASSNPPAPVTREAGCLPVPVAAAGIVNVAAVDCDEHKSIAGEHGVQVGTTAAAAAAAQHSQCLAASARAPESLNRSAQLKRALLLPAAAAGRASPLSSSSTSATARSSPAHTRAAGQPRSWSPSHWTRYAVTAQLHQADCRFYSSLSAVFTSSRQAASASAGAGAAVTSESANMQQTDRQAGYMECTAPLTPVLRVAAARQLTLCDAEKA